ncbi:uncharacterized protein V6R79_018448 [Siganus canaliculatus]
MTLENTSSTWRRTPAPPDPGEHQLHLENTSSTWRTPAPPNVTLENTSSTWRTPAPPNVTLENTSSTRRDPGEHQLHPTLSRTWKRTRLFQDDPSESLWEGRPGTDQSCRGQRSEVRGYLLLLLGHTPPTQLFVAPGSSALRSQGPTGPNLTRTRTQTQTRRHIQTVKITASPGLDFAAARTRAGLIM